MPSYFFFSLFIEYKSILTLEEPEAINVETPISILSIAKAENLSHIYVSEDSFSGFYKAYHNCKKKEIQFIFGLVVNVVDSIANKESYLTSQSKVIVWLKNTDGYQDILKINNFLINEGYNHPESYIDWENLNRLITNNLIEVSNNDLSILSLIILANSCS